jgi:hypothetical protein
MSREKGIKKEMDVLRKALKEDEGYYISWKANIAMAFKDEYDRNTKKYKNKNDIHEIANKAAKNFLNILIG